MAKRTALDAVFTFLAERKGEKFTAEQVGAALYDKVCGGTASQSNWAAEKLRKLADEGKVKRNPGGRGVISVFWIEDPKAAPPATASALNPKKKKRV